jgi:predicted phosphodiesterase
MLEDLENLGQRGNDKRTTAPKEAWRPQLELDADGGFFVSSPRTTEPGNAEELLDEFDLNPAEWIVTNVRRSKWQTYSGEWLQSYRVSLKPASYRGTLLDASRLEKEIKTWRPPKSAKPTRGDLTAIYAIGDTQWGKDAGDGTEGTVRRVRQAIIEAQLRHKELKHRGIGQIALPQMGDCIEGVVSQGGKIAGRLDLSLTSQIRVGRRVLLEWIKGFAPLTESLIVPVVPGNHDESHRQLITDPMDSWQVEIVAQVMDIAAENPALAHVVARYAERDHSTLTVDLSGTLVGFVHGHQFRGGAEKWLAGQSLGQTAIGNCDVLLSAHYHHYIAQQIGPRLWVQIPAMDGGSAWWRDAKGLESPTGLVGMVVGEGHDPRRDLTVLAGEHRI